MRSRINSQIRAGIDLAIMANLLPRIYTWDKDKSLCTQRNRLISRVKYWHKKYLADPGDCNGDEKLLIGLAIAMAYHGYSMGWIPVVQKMGCEIADIL